MASEVRWMTEMPLRPAKPARLADQQVLSRATHSQILIRQVRQSLVTCHSPTSRQVQVASIVIAAALNHHIVNR